MMNDASTDILDHYQLKPEEIVVEADEWFESKSPDNNIEEPQSRLIHSGALILHAAATNKSEIVHLLLKAGGEPIG